jgi:hypothetical protein
MSCKVKVNRTVISPFGFIGTRRESWEGTGLKDNARNRQRAEVRAVLISEEMERGTFDYLKWFPEGNKADEFRLKVDQPDQPVAAKPQTIKEFYEEWIEKKTPPFVRRSLEHAYRQYFKCYIIPHMGDRLIRK